jgi:hypothetical protein
VKHQATQRFSLAEMGDITVITLPFSMSRDKAHPSIMRV